MPGDPAKVVGSRERPRRVQGLPIPTMACISTHREEGEKPTGRLPIALNASDRNGERVSTSEE